MIRSLRVQYFSLTTCQAEQDDRQCRHLVRRDLGKALAEGEPEKRTYLSCRFCPKMSRGSLVTASTFPLLPRDSPFPSQRSYPLD